MKYLTHSLSAAARWILLRALVAALPLSAGAVGLRAVAKLPPASASALHPLASSAGNEDTDDDEEDADTEPGDGTSQLAPGAPPSSEPGGFFPGPPGETGPSGTNPSV